ncbi:hypothetical protein HK103_005945 [Boothiomyces macroporosus]|uniref:ferroxidase n=1 Tax=Boothiomyces macroporosus TaxID=261099 RepID=A0AAD5ULD3_9FUNG|nr:hypothetical protein HK103_005945 [Boothiomyces macroporosus]
MLLRRNLLQLTTRRFRFNSTLTDIEYHKHADRYLDNLVEYLEEFGDQTTVDGYDVLYSSGVMTLKLGAKGTYVLNKQPPNKQIWLSSPISGPKRFDLNGLKTKWIYSRTGISLNSLLDDELTQLLESKIKTPE